MTPRSLFIILIKVSGIYFILESLVIIPGAFSNLFSIAFGTDNSKDVMLIGVLAILLQLLVYYLILRYCIFKPDWIVDKLSLDKHFKEDKFELNIHRSTIISIVIILSGLFIFSEAIPDFFKSAYTFVGDKQRGIKFGESPNTRSLIYYSLQILVGFFLFTNHRLILNLVERQRKK
ncbi:MAG: hypothetical protein IPJ79_08290 [Bacteroidetes bacterium]|nr:hypothetical protein [Bacteroidota bacterium]HNR19476.1 hypothetical protein [Bacteroidia bacterium]HNU32926.1 hypothetical protein [Bacteroidia bacterium]